VTVEAWDTRGPDVVLACSEYIRRRAVDRGVPIDRTFTAMSGVDATMFHPREGWLDPVPQLRLLCIGRLDPNKGHDAAVAAVRGLAFPVDISLAGASWWYGDAVDDYASSLLRDLAAVGGSYLGLVPRGDVGRVFREHDVCLVLSRSQEPLGLVALEAMASGLAVIASPRGGLPEACGDAAQLVDPDDIAGIQRALEVLSEPGTLVEAKRRARARSLKQPWSATAEALLRAALRND
jgi:glycosyltransferase involved in cell wall biosynthesis